MDSALTFTKLREGRPPRHYFGHCGYLSATGSLADIPEQFS